MTKRKPTGYVLWEGASQIDGKPIVCIATLSSDNEKTGAMVQTWILCRDVHPCIAVKTGEDQSVCGNCPHRGKPNGKRAVGRSCYVNITAAPSAVWRAYQRGLYPAIDQEGRKRLYGKLIRIGSYGDPMAVPIDIWETVVASSGGWTGYTHRWEHSADMRWSRLLMASVDSPVEAIRAQALGWRTFRVRLETQPMQRNEVVCPASAEAGKRSTCNDCRLCSGASKLAKDVVIIAHGGAGLGLNARRLLASIA